MAVIPPDAGVHIRTQTDPGQVQALAPVRGIPAGLPEFQPGQAFTARIQEVLPDATYKALVAGKQLTLQLPEGANPGDVLELTVVDRTPRTVIARRTEGQPTPSQVDAKPYQYARISDTGQLIGRLLTAEGKTPPPAALNRGQPLVAQPPGTGVELAPALQKAVSQSGLFYEAHQAQWVAGERNLASLRAEPQGTLPAAPRPAPLGLPASTAESLVAQNRAPTGATESLYVPNRTPTGTTEFLYAPNRPFAGATGSLYASSSPFAGAAESLYAPNRPPAGTAAEPPGALQQSNAAAARGEPVVQARPESVVRPGEPSLARGEGQTQATAANAAQANTTPNVPDAIRNIVQQQLDAVATQRLAWHGEVWPGQSVDWAIQRDSIEDRDPGATEAGEAPRWSTSLRLTMPRLGTVDAVLQLSGNRLRVRLATTSADAANDLRQQTAGLTNTLSEAGLEVRSVEVRHEE
ncbi:MAG: flagellar hook-length control protein FliK [Gammaproteobacteria bacterium]|nr:flagellar hook-length control protein FliK [Gammaproteobacteria bacterium]MBU1415458.1 flagellar hook-length control protein FliK [Gammaproteobacteria bacterium]